ncbi:MAG: DUF6538 domain-containing protein [Hyphomicrobiaceae bacterium]
MAQPWRHPTTGVWYYRARLPSDLLQVLSGRSFSVDVAGLTSTVKLGPTVKVSLKTKDIAEARLRHSSVSAQVEARWATARQAPAGLSHREIHEIAGEWYRDFVGQHEDEPGPTEQWSIFQDLLLDGAAYLDPTSDGVESAPYHPRQAERILEPHIKLDPWLERHGYSLDKKTRADLLTAVASALIKAAQTLERRSEGDYSPDPVEARFPVRRSGNRSSSSQQRSATLVDAFEAWAKEAQPKQKTVDEWRKHIEAYIAFSGTDQLNAICKQSVIAWKDRLLAMGNSPATIRKSKLAALRVVLGWAVDNGRVEHNAAAGVTIKRGTKPGQRMRNFDLSDAAAILQAAARESSPVYRWVPLLCALAGARVSEICQLRAEDIRQEGDIWFMDIKAEAGSVKTVSSERRVPLHPYVLSVDFLKFVETKGSGPLFFDPSQRKVGAKRPQPKILAKNVAAWVHTLGLEVGRRHRKDPNHAWRHLFRALGLEQGIDKRVLDAIQGHAPRTAADAYGEVSLRLMERAVRLIPLPGLWEGAGGDDQS